MRDALLQEFYPKLASETRNEIKNSLSELPADLRALVFEPVIFTAFVNFEDKNFAREIADMYQLNPKDFLITLAIHGRWEWLASYLIDSPEFKDFRTTDFLKELTQYATSKESIVHFVKEIMKNNILPPLTVPKKTFAQRFFTKESRQSRVGVELANHAPSFLGKIDERYHSIIEILRDKYKRVRGEDIAEKELQDFIPRSADMIAQLP